MRSRQNGFTLIEIVIAFTILAMSSVLVVNMITQSATRVSHVNEHLAMMEALDSAIAILRGEIASRELRETYSGEQNGGYHWQGDVLGKANSNIDARSPYLNLYRVRVRVFDDREQPRLELTTIIPDR